MGCGSEGPDDGRVRVQLGDKVVYISPVAESDANARTALLPSASEDVSSLLTRPQLDATPPVAEEKREYLPDPVTDWVIDVQFEGDPRLDPNRVSRFFDTAWYERYGSMTIYGLDADTGRWTYLVAADGPKQVTRMKIAWAFISPIGDDTQVPAPEVFAGRRDASIAALRPLGNPMYEVSLSPERATEHAGRLRDLKSRLDFSPTLVLRAPRGQTFKGKDVWDVMLCLGLEWGDMDIFHWNNPTGSADDSLFSVWTSTPPGYFFPERIADGVVFVEDLSFGFSAPRCTHPVEVFESMSRAVEYARKRLGGTIVDEKGVEADLEGVRRRLQSLEQTLKSEGLAPGGVSALRLF